MESMGRKITLALGLLALIAPTAGCSFVFADGPPAAHMQMPYFDCTSTYGLSVADGVFALGSVVGAATTFNKSKQEYADQNNGASRNAAGGLNIATAAVFTASAIYGGVQASRCGEAKRALESRIIRPMLPPRPVRPPPFAGPSLFPAQPPAAPAPMAPPPGPEVTVPPAPPAPAPAPTP